MSEAHLTSGEQDRSIVGVDGGGLDLLPPHIDIVCNV